MLITIYCKDLLHILNQHYHIYDSTKIDDLSERDQQQIALIMLKEDQSPFCPTELLLLPDNNKETIVSILEEYWHKKINSEQAINKIFNKVICSKKNQINELFQEVILESKEFYKYDARSDYEYYSNFR